MAKKYEHRWVQASNPMQSHGLLSTEPHELKALGAEGWRVVGSYVGTVPMLGVPYDATPSTLAWLLEREIN